MRLILHETCRPPAPSSTDYAATFYGPRKNNLGNSAAVIAGCDARRPERGVAIPHKRRTTKQRARQRRRIAQIIFLRALRAIAEETIVEKD